MSTERDESLGQRVRESNHEARYSHRAGEAQGPRPTRGGGGTGGAESRLAKSCSGLSTSIPE
jgi:hypothetical protein